MVTTYTVWICSDCMMLLANGEVTEGAEQPPMALLDGMGDVTPGLTADEHHEDCDLRNSAAAREVEALHNLDERTDLYDCNLGCEDKDFSHQTCDGCGGLPGARHAATVWPPQDEVNELFGA